MKHRGTSVIFVDDQDRVLLLLRDDKPEIKYPNMWDIPGGGIEGDETPEGCIRREMLEEIGIDLDGLALFEEKEFPDRTEYTFWKRQNLDIDHLVLTEGQMLRWFTREEAATTPLAFGFNETIARFFDELPSLTEVGRRCP